MESPELTADALPAPTDDQLAGIIERLRSDPQALAQVVAAITPDDTRHDGWTPFARRLFLEVLSETGRVTLACDYAQLSKQSAYALRARDPVFAAGWDAACELARAPLADALYEQALDGTTETITRDGQVVATRHRFDSRLSIAVLNRLDKRCDRAMDTGAHHLAIVRRWDEWLDLVGKGEEQAAQILLESPRLATGAHGQPSQLSLGENPILLEDAGDEAGEDQGLDLGERCWESDESGETVWMTDFPPPPGYDGYESRPFHDRHGFQEYERECTAEEVALLEAGEAAGHEAFRAEEEQLRDAYFMLLRTVDAPEPPAEIAGTAPQPT